MGLYLTVGFAPTLRGNDEATLASTSYYIPQWKVAQLDPSPVPTTEPTLETATPGSTPIQAEEDAAQEPLVPIPEADTDCSLGPIEQLICSYDWDHGTALRVARCESGVNAVGVLDGALAVSAGGDYGVYQLHAEAHAPGIPDFWEHWMLPEYNIAWAYGIWAGRQSVGGNGWLQWSCY